MNFVAPEGRPLRRSLTPVPGVSPLATLGRRSAAARTRDERRRPTSRHGFGGRLIFGETASKIAPRFGPGQFRKKSAWLVETWLVVASGSGIKVMGAAICFIKSKELTSPIF